MWLALLFSTSLAVAERYWDRDELVADVFGDADVTTTVVELSDDEVRRLRKETGRPVPSEAFDLVVARTQGVVSGYLFFDHQKGQHQPIDFAVQLSPGGVVVRQEIVEYRERYGHQVRDSRFRAQFVGKGPADALVPGKDVEVVSGATISSVAMTIGVRRAIALIGILEDRRKS